MSPMTSFLDQLREAASQHANPGTMTSVLLVAGGLLIVGIVIGSLGAKFARAGITTLFVVFGACAGYRFGEVGDFPPILCAAIGGAMVGVVSFVTFRLWVGVAAGLVLTALSLGGFGYQRVLPHAKEFNSGLPVTTGTSIPLPHIPSPQEQQSYRQRDFGQYVSDWRAYLAGRDATVERDAGLLAAATFLTGLLLGVLAVRWMAIIATSVVGTVLVVTASLTLLAQLLPEAYQSLGGYPAPLGIAMAVLFLGSVIVQFMVTRTPPSSEK